MYCLITARSHSERLPGKHFLELGVEGRPMIKHVELRCTHFGFAPVVCVPAAEVSDFDLYLSCPVYGGDPDNIEARLIECAHGLDIKQFHHLDGDDPWFDERSIIASLHALMTSGAARIRPSHNSQSGSGRVGTSYSLMSNAKGEGVLLEEGRVHPWPQRLTVDYLEDYYLCLAVYHMVGGYMTPRSSIDDLFVRNPDLHRMNSFLTERWKDRQLREGQHERPSSGIRAAVQREDRD